MPRKRKTFSIFVSSSQGDRHIDESVWLLSLDRNLVNFKKNRDWLRHSSPCITVNYRQVIAYTGVGYCVVYLFLGLPEPLSGWTEDSTLSFCLNLVSSGEKVAAYYDGNDGMCVVYCDPDLSKLKVGDTIVLGVAVPKDEDE